jgi:hypothetical protein
VVGKMPPKRKIGWGAKENSGWMFTKKNSCCAKLSNGEFLPSSLVEMR